ncbi:MAG TPA: NAD(P)/FAD-dependent oxidoreductase [Pseudolabrys sp.]|nr:NAD(P)/FAD-dependent oxidoreductase [Pseudolabrys sp.]
MTDIETVIVGGGAAGIAAARRLHNAGVNCLIVEARPRLGGRAWTVTDPTGHAIDLGCGWLHSADRNPWVTIAEEQRRTIDRTPPPWRRASLALGFSPADQRDFLKNQDEFFARVGERAQKEPDVAAAELLIPGGRWNNLINAIATYISGAELDRLSARDFSNFDDTGVNWRIVEGYGATIAACGEALPVKLDCPVRRIDHSGKRLKIETPDGSITAEQVIVTVPSAILAESEDLFFPSLPDKVKAARNLPLGLADKLFLSLEHAEEFEKDSRLFGATDRTATATYHLRPFGRPQIEAYFGGRLAADLETEGDGAFFDFAVSQLTGLLGSSFAHRVSPIRIHRWRADPFARGSYSYALPRMSDCRATLAAPVDDRLFFAGEACSRADFSTAHGGWNSGIAAAEQVLRVRVRA